MSTPSPSLISPEEFLSLVETELPLARVMPFSFDLLVKGRAHLRVPFQGEFVRPGGTVSGPVLMMAADAALYAATLSCIGLEAMAVTSQLNFHFLRRPAPVDLLVHAHIVRLGRSLVTGEILLYSGDDPEPVAMATGTYCRPAPLA